MATEKGYKRGKDNSESSDKKFSKGKSGWSKPDGTPLRKRKGAYFPDKEIEKRKPGRRDERSGSPSSDTSFRNNRPDRTDRKPGRTRFSERADTEHSRSHPDKERDGEMPQRTPSRFKSSTSERTYDRKKPFQKKREKYAKKDHSKEMRGRFDKDKRKPYAGPHRERKKSVPSESQDSIRLNKYIANAGICSRREADDLITAGLVSINGEIITELGTKVQPGDEVKFHNTVLKTEKHVYVLLNKPKDYITTTSDPDERKTVMSLVSKACKERIVPVGRLDRNTTGLLLISNDGELTKRLTHPSTNIKKVYQVELDKNLSQSDMLQAAAGVELEDGVSGFDEIHYLDNEGKNVIGVELHSGKNRIVRRIFEELGYKVKKLDRTVFAGLTKKDLPRGRWRFLTEMEVNMLKMLTGKKNSP